MPFVMVFVCLAAASAPLTPLERDALVIRGRAEHPCVNLTARDVSEAKERAAKWPWAKQIQDRILSEAEPWLRETDAYWLAFLPKPGACYAYGFTGDPTTGGSFGTWGKARCDWEHPGQVKNAEGRYFPNEECPDDGAGYKAPDGRIHYFTGIWNAWVTEQWTLDALPALSDAYLLTGEERYAERGVLLLDALASIYAESTSGSWDYPSTPPSGRFARPWYQVARNLVHYVDFYDALFNSPAMTQASLRPGMNRRENIEQFLLMDGAYYCYAHSFSGGLHNGHADYMRGALAVGCVLDVPELVRHALESPYSIHAMLANNIDRDGRYYETSLGYAIHARELYLTFADPLVNLRSAEYPQGVNLYDDPKMRSCLLLPELQVQLAGRMPNFGDCAPDITYTAFPEHPFSRTDYRYLERLYAMSSVPEQREQYAGMLLYSAKDGLEALRNEQPDEWMLWHAAEAPQGAMSLPGELGARVQGSWVAGMKGMALLRCGDQAALLRFGPSLTHGDPDDLGLSYYANGYEFTYDIGYGLGSTHVHVGWASSTVSHCLITVDESNQFLGEGSGGSLRFFGDLPGVKVVEATSENSYSSQNVTEYRRTLALVSEGKYLVDIFHVTGGRQHDFGFGSLGAALEPFGVAELTPQEGSLAEGVAWGQNIGNDGDIKGYPNKPYWNPPPGNGYGFFYNVRRGTPEPVWGGTWRFGTDVPTKFRIHMAGDEAEAIFADAPGLYPSKPLAGYVIARRKVSGDAPLKSTFAAVHEPFEKETDVHPVITSVRRLGESALEIARADGNMDVLLFGAFTGDSAFGPIVFEGDFALLTGSKDTLARAELLGVLRLEVAEKALDCGAGVFEAEVTEVDLAGRSVLLDRPAPENAEQLVAVFSNSAYSRSSAYHISRAEQNRLYLQANSLSLGRGRVQSVDDAGNIVSDIPHEYARAVNRKRSTRFFDGKQLIGTSGASTRVISAQPGDALQIRVEKADALVIGELFEYRDLSPGDRIRISLPRVITGQE